VENSVPYYARGVGQLPLEQHFRINDISSKLGISRRTVIRWVDEKINKVPTIEKPRSRHGRIVRKYTTRLIPESVVRQIYNELLGSK